MSFKQEPSGLICGQPRHIVHTPPARDNLILTLQQMQCKQLVVYFYSQGFLHVKFYALLVIITSIERKTIL
jgi:hypothetical protein